MERHALFFRHRLELLRYPRRHIADIDILRHDADLARLDFREVENVVDEPQQFQPAIVNDLGLLDLLLGQVAFFIGGKTARQDQQAS